MAKPRGGLGKGLGSLFEESASARSDSTTTLPLREIEPDRDQPRKEFDEESIAQLAASIAEHGLLQPIAVRPNPMGGYKIIAGERRWRAARQAGLTEVPVVVREDVTEQQAMELALIENLQREDLNPIEEATGYRQLMDRCGLTQEQAAQRLCRSRSAVANSLRLLNLPGEVTEMLRDGRLSTGHAKVLLGLDSPDLQKAAAVQVVKQGLNVRQTEQLCKKLQKAPRQPAAALPRPSLAGEVEAALQNILGGPVKVEYKNGRGSLKVEFYSDAQLRAFAHLLGQYDPEEGAGLPVQDA